MKFNDTPPPSPKHIQNTDNYRPFGQPDTPPPPPPGIVRLEYDGNWVLFESKLSEIKLYVNRQLYGTYKFKQPFMVELPVYNGHIHLKATLAGLRSSELNLNVYPGTTERVYLDYNRAWGSISLKHIQS